MWDLSDIPVDLDPAQTEHPIITIEIETPTGVLLLMAAASRNARSLTLSGLNVEGASANAIGVANLLRLTRLIMDGINIDELSLREQSERLAQRPAGPRVLSGSPVTVRLEGPRGHRAPLRITVVKLLAHQGGMGIKPAVDLLNDRLLVECEVTETLSGVQDLPALIEDLAKADVTTTVVEPALAK